MRLDLTNFFATPANSGYDYVAFHTLFEFDGITSTLSARCFHVCIIANIAKIVKVNENKIFDLYSLEIPCARITKTRCLNELLKIIIVL